MVSILKSDRAFIYQRKRVRDLLSHLRLDAVVEILRLILGLILDNGWGLFDTTLLFAGGLLGGALLVVVFIGGGLAALLCGCLLRSGGGGVAVAVGGSSSTILPLQFLKMLTTIKVSVLKKSNCFEESAMKKWMRSHSGALEGDLDLTFCG